jgi:hypothetical protein
VSAAVLSMWHAQTGVGPWSQYEPDRSCANHDTVLYLGSESDWNCLQSSKDCKYKSPENTSAIVVVSPNAKDIPIDHIS